MKQNSFELMEQSLNGRSGLRVLNYFLVHDVGKCTISDVHRGSGIGKKTVTDAVEYFVEQKFILVDKKCMFSLNSKNPTVQIMRKLYASFLVAHLKKMKL